MTNVLSLSQSVSLYCLPSVGGFAVCLGYVLVFDSNQGCSGCVSYNTTVTKKRTVSNPGMMLLFENCSFNSEIRSLSMSVACPHLIYL